MSIEAVDYVFRTLAATFGAEWDRALGNAPIADVKTVWLDALEPYTRTESGKRIILWALKNLPDRAPNVRQFVAICRLAPAPDVPKLPEPKADPERVKAELAKLGDLQKTVSSKSRIDPKAWADRIIDRNAAGERINPTTLSMARNARNLEVTE
jgi:ribonuclease D